MSVASGGRLKVVTAVIAGSIWAVALPPTGDNDASGIHLILLFIHAACIASVVLKPVTSVKEASEPRLIAWSVRTCLQTTLGRL